MTIAAPLADANSGLFVSSHGPRPLPAFLALAIATTHENPQRVRAVLAGIRKLQNFPREVTERPWRLLASAGRARLMECVAEAREGRPLILLPSIINPATIFDLLPDRSLVRWLARQGYRPLLVDWGPPHGPAPQGADAPPTGPSFGPAMTNPATAAPAMMGPDLAEHALQVARLLQVLPTLGVDTPPPLIGYCLGGTLAVAVASLIPVRGVALIATPWYFSGYPANRRAEQMALWRGASGLAERLGVLPMEVIQQGFWQMDADAVVEKYAAFGRLDPDDDEARAAETFFVAMEDWANAGEAVPAATARDLFEGCFQEDMTGRGDWRVGGRNITLDALACPLFDVSSLSDKIVPQASAAGRDFAAGHGTRSALTLDLGHVGMMVGGRAEARLWTPLHRWLSELGPG